MWTPQARARWDSDCVRLIEAKWQASVLAAGHLEDFMFARDAVIDRIEAEARRSPWLRVVVSGVWLHDSDRFDPDDHVQRRIERIQAATSGIDANNLPPTEEGAAPHRDLAGTLATGLHESHGATHIEAPLRTLDRPTK